MRGSSRILNSGPDDSLSDSTSAWIWSASERMVRNLKQENGSPPMPGRRARERVGARGGGEERAAGGEEDGDRDQHEQRAEQEQEEERTDEVERPLDGIVEAVEDRRAQLE